MQFLKKGMLKIDSSVNRPKRATPAPHSAVASHCRERKMDATHPKRRRDGRNHEYDAHGAIARGKDEHEMTAC